MTRVFNIKKSLRQDHSPLVTSVVRVDPSNFTVLTWCSDRERERERERQGGGEAVKRKRDKNKLSEQLMEISFSCLVHNLACSYISSL